MNVLQNFASSGYLVALILIVASTISGCSYALCQNKSTAVRGSQLDLAMSGLGTCLVGLFGLPVAIIVAFALNERPFVLLVMALLIPSSWLEHRLSGTSNSFWEALWVILSSCLISLLGGVSVAVAVVFLTSGQFGVTLWDSPSDAYTLYFWALYAYPLLAPVAAWVWRGFKPKRGVVVDISRDEIEEERH